MNAFCSELLVRSFFLQDAQNFTQQMKNFQARMSELEKRYDEAVAIKNEAVVRIESLEMALKEEQDRNKKVKVDYQLCKVSSEDRVKYLER